MLWERTVKMKVKQRLQGRGAGKSLFKLPNLIEVEAGRRISEREQTNNNWNSLCKVGHLDSPTCWLGQWSTGGSDLSVENLLFAWKSNHLQCNCVWVLQLPTSAGCKASPSPWLPRTPCPLPLPSRTSAPSRRCPALQGNLSQSQFPQARRAPVDCRLQEPGAVCAPFVVSPCKHSAKKIRCRHMAPGCCRCGWSQRWRRLHVPSTPREEWQEEGWSSDLLRTGQPRRRTASKRQNSHFQDVAGCPDHLEAASTLYQNIAMGEPVSLRSTPFLTKLSFFAVITK